MARSDIGIKVIHIITCLYFLSLTYSSCSHINYRFFGLHRRNNCHLIGYQSPCSEIRIQQKGSDNKFQGPTPKVQNKVVVGQQLEGPSGNVQRPVRVGEPDDDGNIFLSPCNIVDLLLCCITKIITHQCEYKVELYWNISAGGLFSFCQGCTI